MEVIEHGMQDAIIAFDMPFQQDGNFLEDAVVQLTDGNACEAIIQDIDELFKVTCIHARRQGHRFILHMTVFQSR